MATMVKPSSEIAKAITYCHKCGRPNIVWFGPNEIWNKAVRAVDEKEILCPVCFVRLAEQAGFKGVWKVAPGGPVSEDAAVAAAREIAANYEVHKDRCHSNERYPSPACDCGATKEIAAIITKHCAPAISPSSRLLYALISASNRAHIAFHHGGEWKDCGWIQCQDDRKMVAWCRSATPADPSAEPRELK